jgi:hypothetical protein
MFSFKKKISNYSFMDMPPPPPPEQHPVLWVDDLLQEGTKQLLMRSKTEKEAHASYVELQRQCISHAYWQGFNDADSPLLVERYTRHPFLLRQGVSNSSLMMAYMEGLQSGLRGDKPTLRKRVLTVLRHPVSIFVMLYPIVFCVLWLLFGR